MALWENGFRVGTGVAVGIGALILLPVIVPVVSAVLKPVIKAGIKGGIILQQKAREMFAEASETMEDLVEEVKAEIVVEQDPIAPPTLSEAVLNH